MSLSDGSGVNRVRDFSGADGGRVRLDAALFDLTAGPGALPSGLFASGSGLTQGTASQDQFLFDTALNTLRWDADGSGSGASVAVATFNTALSAGDILVL